MLGGEGRFFGVIRDSWNDDTLSKNDLDKWEEKARRLRRHVKGWHINVEGSYKKERNDILEGLVVPEKVRICLFTLG